MKSGIADKWGCNESLNRREQDAVNERLIYSRENVCHLRWSLYRGSFVLLCTTIQQRNYVFISGIISKYAGEFRQLPRKKIRLNESKRL